LAHVRRRTALLEQFTALVGTPEWTQKGEAWLAIPRDRRTPRRHRVEQRDAGEGWAIPRILNATGHEAHTSVPRSSFVGHQPPLVNAEFAAW
jgi:hypothetical protein